MATKIGNYLKLLKNAGGEFLNDNAMKLSASLAYYTIFSIGPLLLMIVTLIGIFFKNTRVTIEFHNQIQTLIGTQGADQLFNILDNIRQQNHSKLFGIISAVILVFGATGVFTEIQGSINYIWSIRVKPEKGWLKFIMNRIVSFSLIIGIGFLLIVSLFVNALFDLLAMRLQETFGSVDVIFFQVLSFLLLFAVITILFAIVYKVLPDAKIYWKDALVGASFTGMVFLLAKFLISYYLNHASLDNTYGAATSIIIVLMWVYFSALILYFGAEFTKIYTLRMGRGIEPYSNAVFIIKREAQELENSSGKD